MSVSEDHLSAIRERVSEHAHRQSTVLEQAASTLAELHDHLGQVAVGQRDASAQLGELQREADAGRREAVVLEESMASLKEINHRLSRGVHGMDAVHEQVAAINDVILEIRMLGLNTAIEAARAGEQGAGFQVVASAMRQLARNGARVAEQIGTLVETTRHDLDQLTAETRELLEARQAEVVTVRDRFEQVHGTALELDASTRARTQTVCTRATQAEQTRERLQRSVEDLSGQTSELIGFITGVQIVDVQPEQAHGQLHQYVQQVDVRTEREWTDELGHIETAVHVPIAEPEFAARLGRLRRDVPTLFICRRGGRSARAARVAVELGFREVYNLAGGMLAWREAGLPSVGRQAAA